MPYTAHVWKEGDTDTAALMNHLEQGIANATTNIINVKEEPYNAKGDGIADDTASIQAAVTAAGPPGEVGAVYFPPGTYKVSAVIKIPAIAHLYGASQWTTILKTTSKTAYIFKPEEAEIEIDHLRFEAESIQTAGGAIDGRNFINYGTIHDCTFGSNFFIGIDFSTALGGGAVYMDRLTFAEAATGVKSVGTGIKIGDNTHLAVGYWMSKIYMSAATSADLKVAIDIDFADSINITDSLVYRCEYGVRVGNAGGQITTGLKIAGTTMDTASSAGYYLLNYRDLTLTGCNAQTCGKGVVFAGTAQTASMIGGTVQNNSAEGIWINASARGTILTGVKVNGNNTANVAAIPGIYVEKGAEEFQITSCYVSNKLMAGASGHQKKGIFVEKGKTKNFIITGNRVPKEATEQIAGVVNETEEAGEFYVVANNLEHA